MKDDRESEEKLLKTRSIGDKTKLLVRQIRINVVRDMIEDNFSSSYFRNRAK